MTTRECYRRIATFQQADYIPNLEGGLAPRTLAIWRTEGLPADVSYEKFFAVDKFELMRGVEFGPLPGVSGKYQSLAQYGPLLEPLGYALRFDEAHCMVAVKDGHAFYIGHDNWGGIKLFLKRDPGSEDFAEAAFVHVRGALPTVQEWEAIRGHFQPDVAARYPRDWRQEAQRLKGHEFPLVLEAPSMVGALVQALGFENYSSLLYENRAVLAQVMEARTELALAILGEAADAADFDMLWFWEDMAFRTGPYLAPALFEELAVPCYRRLADWWRARGGQIVAVDSDGDVRLLIPGWLKAGINHIWPLEPFASMDVVALRRQYGHAFSMRGGIDKFVVARGKEAIDRELDRICPVVQDGGYIPHLDHMLPHASFANYCYYMEQKKKLLGSRPVPA